MRSSYSVRQLAILAVFTVSGFAGLIYESIWSHYLKLFLGHAAYAQTLVLSIFMGGMALGAWVAARRIDRIRQLLLGYAIVEVAIGLLGLVFHPIFVHFLDWSFESAIPSLGSPTTVELFKWSTAAALILPQSILLGTTFPLVSGGLVRLAPERAGESLALLYFTNCIGAAAGVLASGFFLIGRVGLPGTLVTAGLLNLTLALTVWIISRGQRETVYAPPANQLLTESHAARNWLLIAAAVTGLSSFLYEMAWIRMLTLVLGSSTHSFELMLAAFITGLAFGGLWIRRRIDSLRDPFRFLGTVLIVMAALGAITVPAHHYTFDTIAWAMRAFAPTESGFVGFNFVAQTVAAGLMIPVTFFAGMTLPVITHSLLRQRGGEQAIGQVYALNTIGCIGGVLLAIHLLMPAIGLKGTVLVAAVAQAILGWTAIRRSAARPAAFSDLHGLAVTSAIIVAVLLFVHPDVRRLTSAVYRHGIAELPENSRVTYLRDGKTATISLSQSGDVISIATNGKPDASIRMGPGDPAPDEITMVMAGALPLLLHPDPKRIANIGFGSGLTSHVLLLDQRVRSLDSIEIEPRMVEAARLAYEQRVSNVFSDPRSRIVLDDAKTFFSTHRAAFDVIVSEPSNPWISGVSTLFSREFYRQIRRYLADGGLLVQWLQIYETDIAVVSSVVRALDPYFADYHIYNVDDSNILIVASKDSPLGAPAQEAFTGHLAGALRRVGIVGIEDLTTRRIGNKALLGPFFVATAVPANSDYFPFVDLNAPRYRFMRRNALEFAGLASLSVPLQELALPDWKTLETEVTPERAWGAREELVSQAGLLAYYVSQDRLDELPESFARLAAIASLPAESCARPGVGTAWVGAVEQIARLTSAYLPVGELQPLWDRIWSSPCLASISASELAFVELLRAVALRDRPIIVSRAKLLLAEPRELGAGRHAYVLTTAAAANIGLGQAAEAGRVLESLSGEDLGGEFGLALKVLLAYAARRQ